MRSLLLWVLAAVLGCGSAPPPVAAPKPVAPAVVAAPAVPVAEEAPPRPKVAIRGLSGTLNTDQVNQTLEARSAELGACIGEVRKRHGFVSGEVHFKFQVDGEGHVTRAYASVSNLGHRALEACLMRVVSETVFPAPAGRADAEFGWSLRVDAAPGTRTPVEMDAELLERAISKHRDDVYKDCELHARKDQFVVTAYLDARGKVLVLGIIGEKPTPEIEAKLDCVADAIAEWRMPKAKKRAKVSFELH